MFRFATMSPCSSYLLVFILLSLSLLGSTQINHHDILASKDVGNTLFSVYRSFLMKKNVSFPGEHLPSNIGQCLADLFALTDYEKLQYIDAIGKPNSGLLFGNNLWFGSVAECRNITDAHYCLATLSLKFPAVKNFTIPTVYWSACFPASCDSANVGYALRHIIFPEVKKAANVEIYLQGDICPPDPPYTTGVRVTLAISGIVLFLCLIGTIVDLVIEAIENSKPTIDSITTTCSNETDGTLVHNGDVSEPPAMSFENHVGLSNSTANLIPTYPRKAYFWTLLSALKVIFCDFVLCFSLVRNTKKIFNTDVPSTAITSINGVRVISISWVILGHTFLIFVFSLFTEDRYQMLKDAKLLSMTPVINGYYSVDSFFFLSGLLVSYTCMRKLQKNDGALNWVLFYVHRFLRLTPSYMYVILFSMYLKRFLSAGPLAYQMYEDKPCEKYWWTNLLYINNFHPKSLGQECIGWSWYLANDMQFFAIAPPLLFFLYKFGWRALLVPLISLSSSTIVIGSIIGYYDLDALVNLKIFDPSPHHLELQRKYQEYIYIKPYCRIQPYLVGFILGYAMHKNFSKMRKPGWIITLVGWAAAFVVGMGLVYGPHKSVLPDAKQWNTAQNVLFGAFERLLWGLVLAWVTYACHYRAGGLIQKFLSAKFWIPLSRLTYSVYLIHLIIIPAMLNGALGTIHYDTYTVAYYFISAVVLSYGAGFILSVCIEFPCDNLENLAIQYLKSILRQPRKSNVL